MHRIPKLFELTFFAMENIVFPILWQILKLQAVDYLIHYVKFEL